MLGAPRRSAGECALASAAHEGVVTVLFLNMLHRLTLRDKEQKSSNHSRRRHERGCSLSLQSSVSPQLSGLSC